DCSHLSDRQPGACAEALFAASAARELALEALDAAAGVHPLLLAGVEGMAVGADLHVHVALGGSGDEFIPARAAHRGLGVLGMDVGLHGYSSCRPMALFYRALGS